MHSKIRRLLVCLVLLPVIGCSPDQHSYFQGYVEGEFLYLASPLAGRLEQLQVRRGTQVEEGAPLFVLESDTETDAVREAEQDLAGRQRQLEDLRKGLRPSELAALEAQLARAHAAQEQAAGEWQRRRTLFDQGFISREERDLAQSALVREQATVAQLRAELYTARLGAREDVIAAAAAELEAARARLAKTQWALAQKRQSAPTAALVFDTFFEEGEFVPADRPVVSLLPPGNIKIRFFIPEPRLAELRLGQSVEIRFDEGKTGISAAISFISPHAEFTPPVIYSRETRSKLVFMVEARPSFANALRLHPGQPVEVHLREEP